MFDFSVLLLCTLLLCNQVDILPHQPTSTFAAQHVKHKIVIKVIGKKAKHKSHYHRKPYVMMRNMCERLVLCVHLCGHQSHQPGIFYKCLSLSLLLALVFGLFSVVCGCVCVVANALCDFQAFFALSFI